MLYRLLQLVKKELQILFGEKRARMMMIGPVIVQTALFPFAATMEVRDNTVAIYNEDNGAESVELSQRIAKTAAFTTVLKIHSQKDLIDVMNRQKALIAVHFPQNFSASLLSQSHSASPQTAQVQVILDGRRSNAGQIANSYISQIINGYILEKSTRTATTILVRNAYNPNLNFKWHILPCLIAIITTLGALIVTALSVAREREEGTFDQLLVTPLTPGYIMAGKTVPGIMVAVGQATIIALAAIVVYRVPFTGSFFTLLLGMVMYGLSLSGVGLFISSICSTQQQAFLGAFSFMIPAMMLSGFIGPIENMPRFLQVISHANPLYYFIQLVKGLFLKQFTFADAFPYLWPMLLIALFTLSVGHWVFRHYIE
ncbi:MAG: ABC transporter permease [Holophagales bacterium]|jgi:ABC-2 type transport system permease protein|nr:ABC transporter permease [Holophagales bacterium]